MSREHVPKLVSILLVCFQEEDIADTIQPGLGKCGSVVGCLSNKHEALGFPPCTGKRMIVTSEMTDLGWGDSSVGTVIVLARN